MYRQSGGYCSIKANPSLEVSYLRVETYLTDVAGDDRPLCLYHRWPEGVRHHGFLDRVHLRRDNPEVTLEIQQRSRSVRAGFLCFSAGKVQVNDGRRC